MTENFRKAAGVNSLDEEVAKVAMVAMAELPEVHGGKVRKAMVSTVRTLHLPFPHDGARNQVQRQARAISMQRTLHILKLKQKRGVRILGAAIPGTVRKSPMKWRILHLILRVETNIGVSGILIPGIMAIASHQNGRRVISGSTMISGATIAVAGIRRNTRTSGMKNLRKIGDMIRQTLQTSSRILNGRLINLGIRQIPQTL